MGIERLQIDINALPAHDIDAGWKLALERVCELVDAQAGFVVLAGRTSDPTDYLYGWRPLRLMWFNRSATEQAIGQQWMEAATPALNDPTTRAFCAGAGQHRAIRAIDLCPTELWQNSPSAMLLQQLDARDRIAAAHSLSDSVEIYLGVDRASSKDDFTSADVETMRVAVKSLGRLCRWLALSFGALPNMTLLTVRERDVLAHLLTGAPEKQFAESLKLTPAYTHQVVVRVYRKLAVSSRAELMSLWLAGSPT